MGRMFADKCHGLFHLVVAFGLTSWLALLPGASFAQVRQTWPDVLNAAKKEGSVLFYGANSPEILKRIADAFMKTYPDIRAEFSTMNSGTMISRLNQERTNLVDGADLVMATDFGWLRDRTKEGQLLAPLGPSLRDWPKNFIFNGTFFTGSYETFVIAYNTKLVSNPPKSYADVLRPEFKDRLGIPQAPSPVIMAWYDWLDKTQGMDFPKKVMAQNPKVFLSGIPLTQAIAAGEIAVGMYSSPSTIVLLVASGAPIQFVVPDPAFGFQLYVAAFRWAKRPNAALVLADWLMSREGQTIWNGGGGSASPLKGIPGAFEVQGKLAFYDPDQWPLEVQKKYTERYNTVYRK